MTKIAFVIDLEEKVCREIEALAKKNFRARKQQAEYMVTEYLKHIKKVTA